MTVIGHDLIVNRADLSDTRIEPARFADMPAPGRCLLRIDRFALTSNNITYGVAHERLGYWNFFPAAREGVGRIPVWGFADVIASAHPQLAEGTRVYGFLPMSTHLEIRPDRVTPHGFVDASPHRQPMSPIYNQYLRTDADPAWSPAAEPMIALFRPLFTTSFLLEDMLRADGFFGADTVILSSASSKTALGLAHLLSQGGGVRVVGLTSPGNRAFVEATGCYDAVPGYDAIGSLAAEGAVYVDMSGDAGVLRQVHARFGAALKASIQVGMTHWQAADWSVPDLPGPKPQFFFAPSRAQQRLAEWGRDGFQHRLGAAWAGFIGKAQGWIRVVEDQGAEAVAARYRAMLKGRVDPSEGLILSMWS